MIIAHTINISILLQILFIVQIHLIVQGVIHINFEYKGVY